MNGRKKRNSSKVNLTISVIFHTALVLLVVWLAARQGLLGKKAKEITVTMVPKEKKTGPPKEKPAPPKVEPPKPAEAPKAATAPPPKLDTTPASPPIEAPAVAAPAAVDLPAFAFGDGAHQVDTTSDPNTIYKGLIERALRSRWNKPEDIADDNFVVEVELSVDSAGNITASRWTKSSGNTRWDASVKEALAATKSISRPPPKGFPDTFITRFDVESQRVEDAIHLSIR